jgi:hypothetical protein
MEVLDAPGIEDKARYLASRIALKMDVAIESDEMILESRFELLRFGFEAL